MQSATAKRQIYFNEYNLLMGDTVYLPLVSGLLRAYAEESAIIRQHYQFMPYIFHIDDPRTIMAQYDNPSIAAFSVMTWNEQLSLRIAEEVKRRYPQCLIIFGGAQPPHAPVEYFQEHPFIDITVRGQGEETFRRVLEHLAEGKDLDEVPSISWRHPSTGECMVNTKELEFNNDLDRFPSPYLLGLFDNLISTRKDLRYQAILETNRGCPFECTFCYWGMGGLNRKFSFHSIERIAGELEWCGRNKILYVFNADSNFGQHKRDIQIVDALVNVKKKYGYPEKFRTCYGKNTDEKIYEVARIMFENGLEKGITLSRQTNSDEVLVNVKRDNIKMSTYVSLQKRFSEASIPVYSELILGLPGETYQTWKEGIEAALQSSGLKSQLFMYFCQVFPNTELADKEYRKKFGIVTQRNCLRETHCSIRNPNLVTEYEHIVVQTNSLPQTDWRKSAVLSIATMVFHGLRIGVFILMYLGERFGVKYVDFLSYVCELNISQQNAPFLYSEVQKYFEQVDRMLAGKGTSIEEPGYGDIYWNFEEAAFLRICEKPDQFYNELFIVICEFLRSQNKQFNENEVKEAILYQQCRMPTIFPRKNDQVEFTYDFPDYFEKLLANDPKPLIAKKQAVKTAPKNYDGRKKDFAKEVIVWGRKNGMNLVELCKV